MILCISTDNCHLYPKNYLVEQHSLRYREVIQKENWEDVYVFNQMEFDQYDNIATEYLVALKDDEVVGVCRLYPTTLPFMLQQSFTYLFDQEIPTSAKILEASRLVLDRSKLTKEERKPIVEKLVLAYMERGLQLGIDAYIGFMLPKIWDSTFLRAGWDVEWLGLPYLLPNNVDIVRAGLMPVSTNMEKRIRETINIHTPIIENHDTLKQDFDAQISASKTSDKKLKEAV